MRLSLPALLVLIGAKCSEASEPQRSIEFGPQIILDGSAGEIFRWRTGSEPIRADEQADREHLARQLISRGDWPQVMKAKLSKTSSAQAAIQRLDNRGLRVLEDGQIVSKQVFVSIVPFIR